MYYDQKTGQMSFIPFPEKFSKEGELWMRFLDFHKQYPRVYEDFKKNIQNLIDGSTVLSSYVVRETMVQTEVIGVDNNFAPYYLRIFLEEFPQYEDFFRLRALKRDKL